MRVIDKVRHHRQHGAESPASCGTSGEHGGESSASCGTGVEDGGESSANCGIDGEYETTSVSRGTLVVKV